MASVIYDDQKEDSHVESDKDFFASHPDLQDENNTSAPSEYDDDFKEWENELGDDSKKELNPKELSDAEDDDDDDDDDDSDGASNQDFYKENPDNKVAFSDKLSLKNVKKKDFWDISSGGRRVFALVGLSGLLMSMVVGLLMFMTIYRSEHLRNLLWDYRFAKFHYQIGKRIKANLVSTENLDPRSTGTLDFEKTSLGQKLRGYSPEEALKTLSEGKMEVTVERGTLFGDSHISAFTDPATGERIVSEHSKLPVPEGAKVVGAVEFESRITASATKVMEGAAHTKYFQKNARKLLQDKVKIKFGDRFKAWKEKLKATAKEKNTTEEKLTEEEKGQAQRKLDQQTALGDGEGTKPQGAMKEGGDAVPEDVADGVVDVAGETLKPAAPAGTKPPLIDPSSRAGKVVSKFKGPTETYSEISMGVFIVTMGCILKDISQNINGALATRIDAPMRMAANLFGEAEQTKNNNNVDLSLIQQRNKDFENSEQSAAMQRISGTPESEISDSAKLSVADLPFKFFGIDLQTIATISSGVNQILNTAAATAAGGLMGGPPGAMVGALVSFIPGVDSVTEGMVSKLCSYVLKPAVQVGIMVLDFAALVASFGTLATAESGARVGLEALKAAVKIGAAVGIGKIFFEYAIPKMLFALAGSGGILGAGSPNNGNKADLGATLLASQYGSMSGGGGISLAQAERDQDIAMGLVKQQKVNEMGMMAYISPQNPYSFLSQLSLSLPGNPMEIPGALITKSLGFMFSKSGLGVFGNIISPKAKALGGGYLETYGVPQVGISDEMMNINPVQNALYVDGTPGKLQELKDKYQKCFTEPLSKRAVSSAFSSDDFSMCNDQDAQRLGLYNIDNCAGAGTLTKDTNANNCSVFDGAGDVTTETSTSTAASTTATTGAATPTEAGTATVGSYKMDIQHDSRQMDTCDKFDGTQPPEAGVSPIQYPGSKAIQLAVDDKFGGGAANGIMGSRGKITRCWDNKPDIHTTGRAVDEYFHTWRPDELAAGTQAFGWLVTNAKTIGLQYAKLWRVQWTPGQGFTCVEDPNDQIQHQDHLHLELNWDGALQKTPYFTGTAPVENAITINEEMCPKLYHKIGAQYVLDAPPAPRN